MPDSDPTPDRGFLAGAVALPAGGRVLRAVFTVVWEGLSCLIHGRAGRPGPRGCPGRVASSRPDLPCTMSAEEGLM
jgi:hypothetical protein